MHAKFQANLYIIVLDFAELPKQPSCVCNTYEKLRLFTYVCAFLSSPEIAQVLNSSRGLQIAT